MIDVHYKIFNVHIYPQKIVHLFRLEFSFSYVS